ncbi:MAG: hypothetical protein AAB582_03080 [Patescibacteria group bacterium]
MAHHAYLKIGDLEAGIAAALLFGQKELGLIAQNNPDVVVFRYAHFPVEEARRVVSLAAQSGLTGKKLIVIATERIFHEAQNALLKVFEEPPEGTTLVLIVPAEGQLLATMRSRLLPLPGEDQKTQELHPFVQASDPERKKIAEKLLNRAKSDKDDEKQAARAEAIRIVEDLTRAAYAKQSSPELTILLGELNRFTPIMHERSAPLKLIFEHLLLVTPKL